MRQIYPSPLENVDALSVYAVDERPAPEGRPWTMINMITSIDGGVSVDGVSGGLGGPADKEVFAAIRALADFILVGSGTVVAENYRAPRSSPEIARARVSRGQKPNPTLAIVTGRLNLPPVHRVFDSDAAPIVVTHGGAPADRRAALMERAEIMETGADGVDLGVALAELGARGATVVLVEGGPTLNGALVAADLVDEVCLSVSPTLLGGKGARIVAGANPVGPRPMRLVRTLHDDGLSFHRYVRR